MQFRSVIKFCFYFVFKLFILVSIASHAKALPSIYDPQDNFLLQITDDLLNEVSFEEFIPPIDSYDFIVVGAGSGGSVMASRLSEVKGWDVLLIEAGGDETFLNDIPLLAPYECLTPMNWGYKMEPSSNCCLGMNNNQCMYPRGKIMGGTSVLNWMIYSRGNKQDFDNWAALGNRGWSYKDILPYFKKSEDMQIPELRFDSTYHSTKGPLTISYAPYRTEIAQAFVEAGLEIGAKYTDYNGETDLGTSYFQYTMKNGSRWSATRGFIDPVRTRNNLHIRKRSYVTKIILGENNTAVGIEFVHAFKKYVVKARKKVILAAGAINTPQLLMLSGIGPSDHLQEVGIPVAQNLKVGHNLLDHVGYLGLVFITNDTVSIRSKDILQHPENIIDYLSSGKGVLSVPAACEAVAFYNITNPKSEDVNEIRELAFLSVTVPSDPLISTVLNIKQDVYDKVYRPIEEAYGYAISPILMYPKSRGRVLLKNANPYDRPLIFPNYFSHEEDLDKIVSEIKLGLKLSKTSALQKYGSKLHDIPLPNCSHLKFESDEYWKCATMTLTINLVHAAGTCMMGPSKDPDAVVDPRLKVYGVTGLRIADASVMPMLPACHPNAVVYMIAEKAADLVKEDWGK